MGSGEKARVLELCGGSFGTGGGSTMVWNWYSNFDLDKVSVDFCCYTKAREPYVEAIQRNNNQCFVVKRSDNKLKNRINVILELRKIIKGRHYDCVHSHQDGAYNDLLFYWVTKKYTGRVIIHGHSTSMGSSPLRALLHYLARPFLKRSKMLYLTCSEDAAKWLFPASVFKNGQYTLIKNGIDAGKFAFDAAVRSFQRKQLGIENHFVIGHVGRFAYAKNHEFLVDIFVEIKERCPNAVLLLIGGGDAGENLLDEIKEKVHSLGLTESVLFYGNTDRVNELYQAMDCFVFPSRYEGLGIVAIEAQAAGLKTLCSEKVPQEAKITDLVEYMPLSAGAEKWAEKILTYNDGYERKNMEQKVIEAGYDIKMSAKQLENIYLSCRQVDEAAKKYGGGGGNTTL